MTIIVGVKCTDGVVIGSDSIATSTHGAMNLMQMESDDKIRIFNDKVIAATTGSVGYAQRLHYHLDKAINGGGFLTIKKSERPQLLCKKFITDLLSSNAPSPPPLGINFGALVAVEIENEPCLIEYAPHNFQPEFKENRHFYVAMGSGQPLAEPFLAFVSRVLWKGALPDIRLGRFGLFWALTHTISLAPGTIGGDIKLATLSRSNNNWVAVRNADHQEAAQFISGVEERIGASIHEDAGVGAPEPPPIVSPT